MADSLALSASHRAPAPAGLDEQAVFHLKSRWRVVDESLWSRVEMLRYQVVMARQALETQPGRDRVGPCETRLDQCDRWLDEAGWCIEHHAPDCRPSRRWPFTENNTWFWQLVHHVEEELLLVVPRSMLPVSALEVENHVRRNILATEGSWLTDEEGELHGAIEVVAPRELGQAETKGRTKKPTVDEVRRARLIMQAALHEAHERSDRGFRQLTFNALVRAWSTALLVALLIAVALLLPSLIEPRAAGTPEDGQANAVLSPQNGGFLVLLLLLGATGAVVSNMAPKKPFPVAMGPARRYLVVYLAARPLIGAFSGLFLFLLAHSGLLVALDGSDKPDANLLSALTVAFGFSADRVLGPMMEKTLAPLMKTADVSQQTPSEVSDRAA